MARRLTSVSIPLLVLGLVVFLATPAYSLFGPGEVQKEKLAVDLVRDVRKGDYRLVTTAELKKWIERDREMVIVDCMPYEASYKEQHLPGAVQFLFPKKDMARWDSSKTGGKSKEDFLKLLGPDKDRTLVFYCGFLKCDRSHNGAMWASKLGYENVYRYPAGVKGWMEADYPVESAQK
ncbi:MAG: rhodanese-like domain-containing protein [Desulfohalobiaceae bacterium]|nr:rhodanese-like domain-containing protein [Desulfohalobiaceae bacterium]